MVVAVFLFLSLVGSSGVRASVAGMPPLGPPRFDRSRTVVGPWLPWRSFTVQGVAALACGMAAYYLISFGDWSLGAFSMRNWAVFLLTLFVAAGLYLSVTLALGEAQAHNWLLLFRKAAARLFKLKSDRG